RVKTSLQATEEARAQFEATAQQEKTRAKQLWDQGLKTLRAQLDDGRFQVESVELTNDGDRREIVYQFKNRTDADAPLREIKLNISPDLSGPTLQKFADANFLPADWQGVDFVHMIDGSTERLVRRTSPA